MSGSTVSGEIPNNSINATETQGIHSIPYAGDTPVQIMAKLGIASSTKSGYLLNTDWVLFNSKWTPTFTPENAANKSIDIHLGGLNPSDIFYPSQRAIKLYIDSVTVSGPRGPQGVQGPAGSDAPQLEYQCSIDGSTLWHSYYTTGDMYFRISTDGGATWSNAMRFAGPQGPQGIQGIQGPQGESASFETNSTHFKADGIASVGTQNLVPRSDHVHPEEPSLVNQLSSGLIGGGILSIVDNTHFSISAGLGIIVNNYTTPSTPSKTMVTWNTLTVTDTHLSVPFTSVAIDVNGNPYIIAGDFTADQRRDYILIGWVDHSGGSISIVGTQPTYNADIQVQLNDFMLNFGDFNISGNVYSNYTGLQIERSSGFVFSSNNNYANDIKNPHVITTSEEQGCQLQYYYRLPSDSSGWNNNLSSTTIVDPNHWDNNSGTLAVVPSGYWTIQLLTFYAASDNNDIQYGQTTYATLLEAEAAISNIITLNPFNSYDILRGWLLIQQGCTDLGNTLAAKFYNCGTITLQDVVEGAIVIQASLATKVSVENFNLANLHDVIVASPDTGQLLGWNGSKWVNTEPATASAGAGVNLYPTQNQSDLYGTTGYIYAELSPTDTQYLDLSVVCNNNKQLLVAYITDATINTSVLNGGIWNIYFWSYASIDGSSQIVIDFYSRSPAGVETLLFSMATKDLGLVAQQYVLTSLEPTYTLGTGYRVVIKISGQTTNTSNTTIHGVGGDSSHADYINTPLTVYHNDLSGLQGGSAGQYYHLTATQNTIVENTSGTNTGDETKATIVTKIGANVYDTYGSATAITASSIGLGNVDNTSDINKPVSTAQYSAMSSALNALTKSSIGLWNVDNTSDVNKPVSTAQATAISNAIATAEAASDSLGAAATALASAKIYALSVSTSLAMGGY